MDDGSTKAEIAAGFEALAAGVVADRGPPVVKAGRGTARLVKTISREAYAAPTLKGVKPTGVVTHGDVLTGAAHVAALEIATQDGKRPEWIACSECGAAVRVPKVGNVPTKCKVCRAPKCKVCGAAIVGERGGRRRCHDHPVTTEERNALLRNALAARLSAHAARTPEQRSEVARKAQAAMTPEQLEQRSERARKVNSARAHEQRSAAARKAWETRRARST